MRPPRTDRGGVSAPLYLLLRQMRDKEALPLGRDVRVIGRSEWLGEVAVASLGQDIYRYGPPADRQALFRALDAADRTEPAPRGEIARIFWMTFLQPAALRCGAPADRGLSHLVVNLGGASAAEVHDCAAPGGLMIHAHGLQDWGEPAAWWDVAERNGYRLVTQIHADLGPMKLTRLQTRDDAARLASSAPPAGDVDLLTVLVRADDAAPFRT